ncbi:hypothetical protein [Rufibacter roseus]|uniref:Uncharacterized protein n=1 Tax=Rufibacter roseus TaxID=1567108 RepID=A0ABW2DGE6_9BACT|nr:hypothetical protein [Rufibacter roseus]
MRTFLLASMLAFGVTTVGFPVQAQSSFSKKTANQITVTTSSSDSENIKVMKGTFSRKGKSGQTILINPDENGRKIRLLTEGALKR